jgi:hypothetical protein
MSVTKLFQTTPEKLLLQFHRNFTGMMPVPSIVHIVSILQFNDFCQSYGPLMILISKVCPDFTSYTTDLI